MQTNNSRVPRSTVARTIGDSLAAQSSSTKLSVVFAYVTAIEFLTVASAVFFAGALYHYSSFGYAPVSNEYLISAAYIATLFTTLSLGFRHFEMAQKRRLAAFLWSGIGATALAFALFLSTIFLLKTSAFYSRGAFVFQIVGINIIICIFRASLILWLQAAVSSGGVEARRAVLVGNANAVTSTELRTAGIRIIHSIPLLDHEFINVGDENLGATGQKLRREIDFCRSLKLDDVVILVSHQDLAAAETLARHFSELPCDIHIAPLGKVRYLARSQSADFGAFRTLQLARRPLSSVELAVKRIVDIAIATFALIALSPLFFAVALAIKFDSRGGVIFRQQRHGYNNQVIRVFKFRTMKVTDPSSPFVPATENDSRVTEVGHILRQTSIDELPQLINVLFGEMSIVGPRPHATSHNAIFENQLLPFSRRHNVKPGITGWAQVNGYRGPADTIELMRLRLEYDLYYIENWSFLFDVKIILMTLFSKKAYKNAF
jgi:Undecaprenyl-phosphate glucose phosphotransferase